MNPLRSAKFQRTIDVAAIALSVLCAIHCVIFPLAVIFLPMLGSSFMSHEAFHKWMLFGVLPTSIISVSMGCRRHKDRIVFAMATIGLALITVAALWGHDLFGHDGEVAATVIGGIILATSHFRNFKICRDAECDHGHVHQPSH
ncbi:MAG: MerC domain-containing protein [Opitutales bacterium]